VQICTYLVNASAQNNGIIPREIIQGKGGGDRLKVEKKGDIYLMMLTHDELLALVNGLGARNLLIRDVASVINPDCNKKKQKELDKIHKALAEALPPDAWDKEVAKSDRNPAGPGGQPGPGKPPERRREKQNGK